ncbi:glycosyltransferase family 2 protein [Flavobacterium sp.]|uniref:glycosyltransferase family 2 protein n=1 Tax=Flavobacterium sp. TaxID=239 RepID=UPI0035275D7B
MIKGLVSVIIPTYNRVHLIEDTLNSVLNQTYTNWECIVVDDESNDDTEILMDEFCKKDERIKFFRRPETLPKGANSCRNFGFQLSSGEYINWFDSDDIMLNSFLENKIAAFSKDIQFVIASGYYWNPENDSKSILNMEQTSNLYVDYAMWKIKILTPSVLFRKSFLENRELFNSKMKRGQEAEFFSRLFFDCTSNQYKIVNNADFLYRQHVDSKSSKNLVYNKGYKESLFYYLVENFKRAELIKSEILLDFFYDRLIKLLISSNANQHKEVTLSIINNFYPRLMKYDKIKTVELILIGRLMYIFKKSPQKMRKRWLQFKFKWNG